MILKSGQNYDNISISTTFTGEVVGKQCIYLRYAADGSSYLRIRSSNNQIIVEQKCPGETVETLFAYNIALGTGRSRINAKDDTYDAVFQDLKITKADDQHAVLYSNTYSFKDGIIAWLKDAYDAVVNWTMAMF
jgi:hypothetical protein